MAEVRRVGRSIKKNKAPGPDNFPPELVKAVITHEEEYCTEVLNRAWMAANFPKVWKQGRLVLLEKPKKNVRHPATYRPLCLINVMGKVYETIIVQRLNEEI